MCVCYMMQSTTPLDGCQEAYTSQFIFIPWCQNYKIQSKVAHGFDVA